MRDDEHQHRPGSPAMTEPAKQPPPDVQALIDDWKLAVETQEPIGPCTRPGCDGLIRATPPVVTPAVTWLEAECDHCGSGVALPNGRRKPAPASGPLATVRVMNVLHAPTPGSGRDWREAAYKD